MKEQTGVGPKGMYVYSALERGSPVYTLSHGDQTKHICARHAPHRPPARAPDVDKWLPLYEDTWLDGNGLVTISAVHYNQDQVVTL